MKIHDIPGGYYETRVFHLWKEYYYDCDVFVFCYDQKNHLSLKYLKDYYKEVKDYFGMDKDTKDDSVKILMACKYGEPESKDAGTNYDRENIGKEQARVVNSNDLAELRDKKIVFDFEFRCST